MATGISGCITSADSIEGRYQSEVNPHDYLELRNDGSYVVVQDNAFGGLYTVADNTIILTHTFGSFVLVFDGADLIDLDGERWVKV